LSLFLYFEQYQLALHQIDSLRKDGKFVGVDGTIPEGQGIVMAHLNECHELLEMVCPTLLLRLVRTDFLKLKEAMDEGDEEYYDDDDVETDLDGV